MRTSSAPTQEELRARFLAYLDLLADCECPAVSFYEARMRLETLALSTEAAAVARNRLESARKYLEASEHGAACYELRLLRQALTNE